MIRRLLPLLSCWLLAALLRAETPAGLSLNAESSEYLQTSDETVLRGHASISEADLLVTADEFRFKGQQGDNPNTLTAIGHVVYTRGTIRILADRVTIHRTDGSFTAEHVRLGSYPYYLAGRTATGTRREITVIGARITYGEPGPWQPTATASKVIVAPGQRLRFEGAQLGLGSVQPVPFPQFQQNLSEPLLSFITLSGGYRNSLGAYVDAGLHLPVAPGVRIGGDAGYYTARGLLVGPSGTYADPNDPDKLQGLFRSGYINDHGDKSTDVLGRPVPENRAFIEWQHRQAITDELTLTGQLNWWRDSEVLRDFRPRLFFPVQQPDNYVEATNAGTNSFISVFSRFAPNSFEIVQQRLPEIRFDLLPLSVGGGIYERFNASIAALRENPLPGTALAASPAAYDPLVAAASNLTPTGTNRDLRSTRFDAFYGLMRPMAPSNWFTFTPTAGGRVTHYLDTRGATKDGEYTRILGEIGADAELRASGTFDYKNEAWHIDGLRHLFTPRISYRYIPEAQKGRAYIPPIDRETFSTYLQPLDLGDVRNLDDLHATNTLRLALDNTLQTRDPQTGTRDLLTLNVADDFRFRRQPGEKESSDIHTELAAMPTRWLEFGFYNTFTPQDFTLTEFNSGITLHDGTAWTVRFTNNFLRHQLQDYMIDGRARLNEEYDVLTRLRYDQRKHRFEEQSYGIEQNLANTWRISYLVSLYSGPRRESHFGFSIQIDTVRF